MFALKVFSLYRTISVEAVLVVVKISLKELLERKKGTVHFYVDKTVAGMKSLISCNIDGMSPMLKDRNIKIFQM